MLPKVSVIWAFLTLILPFVIAHWGRRHQELALRARGDVDIHKRQAYTNAKFTYYAVGLGACGVYNQASDWIVALNVPQYGDGYPGPECFKSITIQYGGKTAQATIMDKCEVCPSGGLDFSESLFSYLADESMGVIYGVWWYDDATTSSTWIPPSTTWEPSTTTSTPAYTPPAPTTSSMPAYTPPPTTTTTSTSVYTPPATSTTSSTTSSTSTSSIQSRTSSSGGSAAPTGGTVPTSDTRNPDNILVINTIMVKFGIALSLAERSD